MDSDKRSKIEVLLRMIMTIENEVQAILQSEEIRYKGRSTASRESAAGFASRDALKRLEESAIALQEARDGLEAAAAIDWTS